MQNRSPSGVAAALLLALLAACDQTELQPANAWLAISSNNHDFGVIPHGETRTHRFVVQNTASQRVRLKGIRSECTCAVLEKRVLAGGRPVADRPIHDPPKLDKGGYLMTWLEPGEQLEVKVKVDTRLKPPLDHKEPSRSELHFEPQEAGVIVLAYRFEIRARLRILGQLNTSLAPTVDLGQYNKHQQAFGVVELAPRDGRKFRVLGVDGADERLILEPKEATVDGGHRWLVRLEPNGQPGPFQRALRFRTDLDGGYEVPLLVTGLAVGNLQFLPFPRLDLGRFDFETSKRSTVTVIYGLPGKDPEFQVGQIEVKSRTGEDVSSFFEAGVEGGEARRWTLWLRYKGGFDGRGFQGWVQLRSTDEEHPSTVVDFTGFNNKQK